MQVEYLGFMCTQCRLDARAGWDGSRKYFKTTIITIKNVHFYMYCIFSSSVDFHIQCDADGNSFCGDVVLDIALIRCIGMKTSFKTKVVKSKYFGFFILRILNFENI